MDYPEVDWNGPLVTAMVGLKIKIWEWEEDCKWLQVGMGRYMYNNDGTCVSGGGMRVFNPVDHLVQREIEGHVNGR